MTHNDPMKGLTMLAFIKQSWKAVVALLIPIAFGAAAEMVDAISDFVSNSGNAWSGIVVGVLSAVGVWLKANRG